MPDSDRDSVKSTCVVLRTHFIDDELYRRAYLPLERALPDSYHLLVVHDETRNPWPAERFPAGDLLCLSEEIQRDLNPFHKESWYSFDSLLAFLNVHRPGFDYYWILEYDVRFSGDWAEFFRSQDRASTSDALLINGTWPYNGDESWWVWHELQWPVEISLEDRYAGFVFIGRYSRRLMRHVAELIGERSGFSEVYLATLCHEAGLSTAAISSEMIGSVCATNAQVSEDEYERLAAREPDRIFHKVR